MLTLNKKIVNEFKIEDLLLIIIIIFTYTSLIQYLNIKIFEQIILCIFFILLNLIVLINNKNTLTRLVIILGAISVCIYKISNRGLDIHLNIDEALYMSCSRAILDKIPIEKLEGMNGSCFFIHHRWGLPLLGSQLINLTNVFNFFNVNNYIGYFITLGIAISIGGLYREVFKDNKKYLFYIIILLSLFNINLNYMRLEGQLPNLFGIFFLVNIIKISISNYSYHTKTVLLALSLVGISLFFNDILLATIIFIFILNIFNYKIALSSMIICFILLSPIMLDLYKHIMAYKFTNSGYEMPHKIKVSDVLGIEYFYDNYFEKIDFKTNLIKGSKYLHIVIELFLFIIVLNSRNILLIFTFVFIYIFNIVIGFSFVNTYVIYKINILLLPVLLIVIVQSISSLRDYKNIILTLVLFFTIFNFINLLTDYKKYIIEISEDEVMSISKSNDYTKNCVVILRERVNVSNKSYLIQRNNDFILTSIIDNLIIDDVEGLIGGSFANISNLQGNKNIQGKKVNEFNVCALGINRYDNLELSGNLIYHDNNITIREYSLKFKDVASKTNEIREKIFLK